MGWRGKQSERWGLEVVPAACVGREAEREWWEEEAVVTEGRGCKMVNPTCCGVRHLVPDYKNSTLHLALLSPQASFGSSSPGLSLPVLGILPACCALSYSFTQLYFLAL